MTKLVLLSGWVQARSVAVPLSVADDPHNHRFVTESSLKAQKNSIKLKRERKSTSFASEETLAGHSFLSEPPGAR
jgi:hypothetical protein